MDEKDQWEEYPKWVRKHVEKIIGLVFYHNDSSKYPQVAKALCQFAKEYKEREKTECNTQ